MSPKKYNNKKKVYVLVTELEWNELFWFMPRGGRRFRMTSVVEKENSNLLNYIETQTDRYGAVEVQKDARVYVIKATPK